MYAGTSGWAYPEWRPAFYPEGMPANRMLAAYARHFATVEVNNTFYRMPKEQAFAGWRAAVPPEFKFAFKAHRAITHRKNFAAMGDMLARFAELLGPMGSTLGPVLFQFDIIADVPQLTDFLAMVKPSFPRVVVELRHKTWLTDECFDVLRAQDVALCRTETDEGTEPEVETSFAYLRLRKSAYAGPELE